MDVAIGGATLPEISKIKQYNAIIKRKVLTVDCITHNSIILLVLELLSSYNEVKKFYQSYYSLIIVDEFQDTNCIAWSLLETIISKDAQLLFLGDSLQRIYGFIGALPDIMSVAAEKYAMTKIALYNNYRFRNNREMLKLDKNIRANAVSCFSPSIADDDFARLPAFWGTTQQNETEKVVEKIKLLGTDVNAKIAVLFRARGKNAEIFEKELTSRGISYFYGMFTDEDVEYVEFHNKCQEIFIKMFRKSKSINKKALIGFFDSISIAYATVTGKTIDSLLRLLHALIEKMSIDYADLTPEDKYTLLLDIFENKQLKQAMEYVDSQVILSTVHGAKGLEWDYVIIADVERWIFPGYFVCKDCQNKYLQATHCRCYLPSPIPDGFRELALDELSVFYVAITRAKKQVYVSASAKRFDINCYEKTGEFSCMVGVTGIKLVQADATTT